MLMTDVEFEDGLPIEGYGPGGFRLRGEIVQGPILVSPLGVSTWTGAAPALVDLAGQVDVIFLGTGGEIAHADPNLRAAVEGAGMGLEVMNTPAACRTYNVLLGEGRRVALACVPV